MSRFSIALPHVLVHEGGKVDNPKDPGGRTNQGVIQRTFNSWLASVGKPARDVFSMLDSERDAIYRTLYWNVIKGDRLPVGIDYIIFDGAVHSGPRQAVKWLQRALGSRYTGTIDGVIGNLTFAALEDHPNIPQLINAVMDRRLAFLQALSTFSTFGRGWTRRVKEVRETALKMAAGKQIEGKAVTTSDASAKAPITDAKKLPTANAADATSATGASNVTVGVVLTQAREALEPYAGISTYIQWFIVALIIGGAAMTVGGLAWRHFANRKRAQLVDDLNLAETPNAERA